jgi:hypothetical protein
MVIDGIVHKPIFDTLKIEDHYSKKDGVEVKYICTSAPNEYGTYAADIFYRETPHPEFGNHYFALYLHNDNQIMITNADTIEDLVFHCIEDEKGNLHYSAHRWDYKTLDNGNMIDGGRAYIRTNCTTVKRHEVVDGKFVEMTDE